MSLPLGAALPRVGRAQAPRGKPIRIGVLNDQSSVFSDSTGPGSVALGAAGGRGVHRADRHEGRDHRGRPPEQGRCRLGDRARLVRPRRRGCGGGSRQLRRGAGGQHGGAGEEQGVPGVRRRHDAADRRAMLADHGAVDLRHLRPDHGARAGADAGGQGHWFFITADYTFGQSLQDETTRALERLGGKVLGSVKHPLNTADFSSYLLQAKASGANVVALRQWRRRYRALRQAGARVRADAEADAGRAVDADHRRARDRAGCGAGLLVTETLLLGPERRDAAFSPRWSARNRGREPTMMQAGVYGVVLALPARRCMRWAAREAGRPVRRQMKAMPTDDARLRQGSVRRRWPRHPRQLRVPGEDARPIEERRGTVTTLVTHHPRRAGGVGRWSKAAARCWPR